jgi:hypothetical protein
MPLTMLNKLMAPNFFIKVKGPDGSLAVATRQAYYNSIVRSYTIYSLQNYGAEEP